MKLRRLQAHSAPSIPRPDFGHIQFARRGIVRKDDIFRREGKVLAAFAVGSGLTLGREFDEPATPGGFRTPFQQDIDRIIWSNAFQRLGGKTQVFGDMGNDHTRTRQSHSFSVARIAREICQALRLNQDLAEAIALAHDLGHPPFGHSGQDALNALMSAHGGFEHNRHTLRLVTALERRYPHCTGLNLTYEVRDGLCKHFRHAPLQDTKGLALSGNYSLEAAVVNIADQIAYSHHDLEDGFRLGFLSASAINQDVALWRIMHAKTERDLPGTEPRLQYLHTIGLMIKALVEDLVTETAERLKRQGIRVHNDVIGQAQDLVGFSPAVKKNNGELRAFLLKNLYHHERKLAWEAQTSKMLGDLFAFFIAHPDIYKKWDTNPSTPQNPYRSVCDFIAGMTDGFAKETWKSLGLKN